MLNYRWSLPKIAKTERRIVPSAKALLQDFQPRDQEVLNA